jgi:membrane protease YdiL (CAAX protease family)
MDADLTHAASPPRQRQWAAAELLLAGALIVGANIYRVVPVSETPWLVLVGWLSLWRRGLNWKSVGLRQPGKWMTTVAVAIAAAVALQVASEYVTEPLIAHFTGSTPDLSDFRPLVGNLPAALGMLVLVWTLAAFGEEMAYRGYVLERAAALGRHSPTAYVVSMVVVSVLFGVGHWYQGPAGVVGSIFSGLVFGALYLAGGRNLWLPILTHGLSDTIGLALIYLGLAPQLRG